MLDVKTAVEAAIKAINEFYKGIPISGVMIEEVEKEQNQWLITLSFLVEDKSASENVFSLAIGGNTRYVKKYKIFKINYENGDVVSMKIRDF